MRKATRTRLTIAAAILGAAVVALLVTLDRGTVRHDVEAWRFVRTESNDEKTTLPIVLAGTALHGELPRYDVFELSISSTRSYSNPFTDVEVHLQVTAPSGSRTVRGFHDGGNTWRCRYLATEEGSHGYVTSSPDAELAGVSGSFVVGPATASGGFREHGPVRIHPQHPHAMAHHDGTPFFWNGDTEWFFLTHVSSKISQAQRLAAIDLLSAKKVNNLLMTLVNQDAGFFTWPWPGTSAPTDRTSFDLARMRTWEEVILRMRDRGIVADLWFYSDDSTAILPAASSAAEDLYFRYMLARFGAFANVTWNLALEYSEYRSASWVVSRASLVKAERPDAFLAVHQAPDDTYDFPGNTHLDHASLQRFTGHDQLNAVVRRNRTLTATAGRPIPVCHEEFSIEGAINGEPTVHRRDTWAIALAGGYYKGASLGFWIGTPYARAAHFDHTRILYETITKAKWWRMEPRNDLVQSGGTGRYALASADEVLAYSVSGASWTLDLSALSGQLAVRYTDPLTGAAQAGTLAGGGVATITNPFGTGELAVQVTASAPPPPPANEPPETENSSVTTPEDTPTLVQLIYSDGDGPGPYTFQVVQPPGNGVLGGAGNDRTYTPNAGFTGGDSFTWTVHDGVASSNAATVSIVVMPGGQSRK